MAIASVNLPLGPWSFPINKVARVGDLEVSLLSLSVVGDVLRVAGVISVRHRLDLRLDRLPELRLSSQDGPPLAPLGAHLLPQAGTLWTQWLFERPTHLPAAYVAGISQIDLAYRAGGLRDGERLGPITFEFRIDRDAPHAATADGDRG